MRCYCASARQVARRLTRLYEAELRPAGVSPAQFELMANLRESDGVSQAELAERIDVDQTTLSRNLKLLVSWGWVSSAVSRQDGRRVEYGLTGEGRKVLRRAMPYWESAAEQVRVALGANAGAVWPILDRLGGAALGD